MTGSRAEAERALLPAGLRDLLPPDVAHEARTVETLIDHFTARGYERVKPPLVEFESSLFAGPGSAMLEHTFRMMDPVSRRMMGVRADMTVQVARIAATRLAHLPRPLRLCYAGEVLRVAASPLNPERQLAQVGVELIGGPPLHADIEVIQLALSALRAAGARGLTVDLTMPPLVPAALARFGPRIAGDPALREAIDRKDAAAMARLAGPAAEGLAALMAAAGDCRHGLDRLRAIELPADCRRQVDLLAGVAERIAAANADVGVTIDPVENRGFEYTSGLGFSIFARGVRGELGRGGRYRVDGAGGEDSTGFSVYMETAVRALPDPAPAVRVYLPFGTGPAAGERLRGQGRVTVPGLAPVADAAAEARRLRCQLVWRDGAARSADPPGD